MLRTRCGESWQQNPARDWGHECRGCDMWAERSVIWLNAQVFMKQLAESRRSSKDSTFSMNIQETLSKVLQSLENEQQQQQQNPCQTFEWIGFATEFSSLSMRKDKDVVSSLMII